MTDERPGEPLTPTQTDDELDREIETLLAAEPSTEFLAKVRARVDAEPAPGAWRFGWWPAAVGTAVAAALLLAIVVSRPATPEVEIADRSTAPARSPATVDPSVAEDVAAEPAPPPRAVTPTEAPGVLTSGAATAASSSSPEPLDQPVTPMLAPPPPAPGVTPPGPPQFARLVSSQSESAALRRLFAQATDEGLAVPVAPEAVAPVARLEPPPWLEVPPVGIEPITLALLEGVVE